MPDAARASRPARDAVLSLEVLARTDTIQPEQPTQFTTLVRHFLDRFFNSEMASAEGDGKTSILQAACAIGIPPFVLSLYLYPAYHPPFHQVRPYWAQAGDHCFYVVWSLVAMALVTIFEWDLLFPDLLDVLVLSSLPVDPARFFRARVTAIFILIAVALFDANIFAIVVLPAATDPPHLFRFLAAHLAAVVAAGTCAAAFFLALEASLLALLGDRWFRKISLWLQGFFVMALLAALFACPAFSGALPALLESRSPAVLGFPPFWFLGIYQRILDGPATQPVFLTLDRIGLTATLLIPALAIVAYPLAWLRRTRSLVEGGIARNRRSRLHVPFHAVVHCTLARTPAARAIWHFIAQNLLRVTRYRMVLVMYGGAGAALVFATVMRLTIARGHIGFIFSPDGLRATVPIIAFWTVSGLHSTFLAPADQRGRWIFRAVLGKAGLPQALAARGWVLAWSLLLALSAAAWVGWAVPAPVPVLQFVLTQALTAAALSVLLTDVFFLNVTTIPFTGVRQNSATNFALLLIPYLGFFPAIVMFTVGLQPVIESSFDRIAIAATIACVAHLVLRRAHHVKLAEFSDQIDPDEGEEEFPLRLGLRY
jgi:hypothetical protein